MKRFVLPLIFFWVCGCSATGFNRGDLRVQMGVLNPTVNDSDIEEALLKKPNLPSPFKMGVYFKRTGPDWRWTEEDKTNLLKIGSELRSEGLDLTVFPILGQFVPYEDQGLKPIRLAAAKHGADAVLIINGIGTVDRYSNKLAWSYILLVTPFFIPGSEVDALFMADATMWDVRNEYIYMTTEAEGLIHNTYIPVFRDDDKEIIIKAKKIALAKLKIQIKDMLKGVDD